MPRSSRLACLALAVLLLCAGCWSGPWRLSQSWRDQTQDWYSQDAWTHGVLLGDVLLVYPVVALVLAVTDVLFVNPWYFWTHDAWTNRGTAYVHTQPSGPNTVDNVFSGSDEGGWAPGKQ